MVQVRKESEATGSLRIGLIVKFDWQKSANPPRIEVRCDNTSVTLTPSNPRALFRIDASVVRGNIEWMVDPSLEIMMVWGELTILGLLKYPFQLEFFIDRMRTV